MIMVLEVPLPGALGILSMVYAGSTVRKYSPVLYDLEKFLSAREQKKRITLKVTS